MESQEIPDSTPPPPPPTIQGQINRRHNDRSQAPLAVSSPPVIVIPSLSTPFHRPLNQPTTGYEAEGRRRRRRGGFIPHTRRLVWSGVETPRPIIEKLEFVATQRLTHGPRKRAPSLPPPPAVKPEIPAFQPLDFMEEIERER